MKSYRKIAVSALVTIQFLALLSLETAGQKGKAARIRADAAAEKKDDKVRYKNYVWIEGENAATTNFAKEKTYSFFCSDKYALQLSKSADPASGRGYFATYVFYIPRSKSYDLWFACTPPGSRLADKPGYASPVDWSIDDGEFRTASSENSYVRNYYAPGGYYWVKISSGNISAGKHTLNLRVNRKRSSGWDYFFYIDAIVFVPTYSGYLNKIMQMPETAPGDFNVTDKPVRLESEDAYKRFLAKNPNDRETMFILAQIYTWLYDYPKSIALYRRIIERDRKNINARILLANNLAWNNQLEDSIAEYKNIIALDRKNITARKLLAVLAGWNNRYDEAIRNYREIIDIDPKNVDAYISLATQYTWKGEPVKALEYFERAEKVDPNNIAVLYALGDNYSWGGKTYKAIQQFRKIISLDEKEINAYKKLARIYYDLGQTGKANDMVDDARDAVARYPELSSFSLDVKGEVERQKKETVEGYMKSLEGNPEDLGVRKNLVDTYIWYRMDDEVIAEYGNILDYKLLRFMEDAENRLKTLMLEAMKMETASVLLEEMDRTYRKLRDDYRSVYENLRDGREISPETNARLAPDYAKLAVLTRKNDILEKNLSRFLSAVSVHDRDVQSYEVQKDALKWEFDSGKMISLTEKTRARNPKDYRPSKVLGVLHLNYGSRGRAVDELRLVYKAAPERVNVSYPYALADASLYRDAEFTLDQIESKKLARGLNRNDLSAIRQFWADMKSNDKGKGAALPAERKEAARVVSETALKEYQRLAELRAETEKLVRSSRGTMRKIYEKAFLDLENDNVPIYSDISNYYLNRTLLQSALDQYYSILKVQPLNVEINYKLGNINEALGYWKSAMENYEICINNQPDHDLARRNHYELQKVYSPSLNSDSDYYSEKAVTRIREDLYTVYPLLDWMILTAGYSFERIKDKGGISRGGFEFYPSRGSVMMNSGFVKTEFRIVPLNSTLYLEGTGIYYSGKVEFEGKPLYDSKPGYFSLNYGGGLILAPGGKGVSLKLGYRQEDVNELTQSLKMNFRDAITSKTLEGILDLSFAGAETPLLDRIFLYDNVKYRSLSDSNAVLSSYNQVTYRLLRFPGFGSNLDLSGILSYESSKFTQYDAGEPITNLPYWAPKRFLSYGGGIKWEQNIPDLLSARFYYSLYFQYTLDALKRETDTLNFQSMSPGVEFGFKWDRIDLFTTYYYTKSTVTSSITPKPDPFTSSHVTFGIKGRFFSVYTPKGLGGVPIILASASPKIITADGRGKDDTTTFSMTAFDETGIASWELEIFNDKGVKVQGFSQKGVPPATMKWDGADKAGNLLPQGSYTYSLAIVNTAGHRRVSKPDALYLSTKRRAVLLETPYKAFSPNGDKVKDNMAVEFKATDKDRVESWALTIRDRARRVVRVITGYEFLPYDVQWDGKDMNEKVLPDGDYLLSAVVRYTDKTSITSPDITAAVNTGVKIDLRVDKPAFRPKDESLVITPSAAGLEVESWKVMIKSANNTLLRIIQGSGKVPKDISWNGTDEKGRIIGYNLPLKIQMTVIDAAGNRTSTREAAVWLAFLVKGKVMFLFDQGILQKGGSPEFTREGEEIVAKLAAEIKKAGYGKIKIISHTSPAGSAKTNLEISYERARKLAELLKKAKIEVLSSTGMGESVPYEKAGESKWDSRYEIELF